MSPLMPLKRAPRGSLAADRRPGSLGPLSQRAQRTLRQGEQERVPAEYQDIVSRYYRSLAVSKH
jgi:hypothetical protein